MSHGVSRQEASHGHPAQYCFWDVVCSMRQGFEWVPYSKQNSPLIAGLGICDHIFNICLNHAEAATVPRYLCYYAVLVCLAGLSLVSRTMGTYQKGVSHCKRAATSPGGMLSLSSHAEYTLPKQAENSWYSHLGYEFPIPIAQIPAVGLTASFSLVHARGRGAPNFQGSESFQKADKGNGGKLYGGCRRKSMGNASLERFSGKC